MSPTGARETPVVFACGPCRLYGMLHGVAGAVPRRGVLILVGGPQTRVGSHRQFVLLARALAQAGVPVLRFDYRGMGDSEGEMRGFEAIHEDIRAAIDAFLAAQRGLREVVVWGLCDAATAAALYAPGDPRVTGLVLANPWVRTPQGEARALVRHYYLRRLFSAELWRRLLGGEVRLGRSLASLGREVLGAVRPAPSSEARGSTAPVSAPLPERTLEGLQRFEGPLLLILSGRDLTAAEFKDTVAGSGEWRRLMRRARVLRRDLPEADHTFSSARWRDQVADWTLDWLHALRPGSQRVVDG
jgi:exosortase A-associated hydrolase 1